MVGRREMAGRIRVLHRPDTVPYSLIVERGAQLLLLESSAAVLLGESKKRRIDNLVSDGEQCAEFRKSYTKLVDGYGLLGVLRLGREESERTTSSTTSSAYVVRLLCTVGIRTTRHAREPIKMSSYPEKKQCKKWLWEPIKLSSYADCRVMRILLYKPPRWGLSE